MVPVHCVIQLCQESETYPVSITVTDSDEKTTDLCLFLSTAVTKPSSSVHDRKITCLKLDGKDQLKFSFSPN